MSAEEVSTNISKIEEFHQDIQVSQLDTIGELAESLPAEKGFKKTADSMEEK